MIERTMLEKTRYVAKLKKLAMENYEKGGHRAIECWDANDWMEFVSRGDKSPVVEFRKLMKLWNDQEEDIRGTAF